MFVEKSYSDRDAKSNAWNEIAQILIENWDDAEAADKLAITKDLQKKWKHLRDYYIREKKRDGDTRSGSAAKIRKKTPAYFDMLTFIDITKGSRSEKNVDVSHSQDDTQAKDSQTISEPATSDTKSSFQEKTKTTLFQHTLINSRERYSNLQSSADSNQQFLMSLLPEMRSLSERQNFEFRFQIMKLLRRIKYEASNYSPSPYPTSPESDNRDNPDLLDLDEFC